MQNPGRILKRVKQKKRGRKRVQTLWVYLSEGPEQTKFIYDNRNRNSDCLCGRGKGVWTTFLKG